MQTKEYHIKLPKHLSVRLEDVVIERYGYKVRGGITLLILEALEEKLNPNRSVTLKTEKNELAQLDQKGDNSFFQYNSEETILLSNILTYRQQTIDKKGWFITRENLEKAIVQTTRKGSKISIKRYIFLLENLGVLTPWDFKNNRHQNYMINVNEKDQPIIINNNNNDSPKELGFHEGKTTNLTKEEMIDYQLLKGNMENNSFNRMSVEHKVIQDAISKNEIEKISEDNYTILTKRVTQ